MHPAPNHILVVDDNEEILESISVMLARKSFKVSVKNRIENFEQEVRNLLPDLILLDKNLGWADGCDLCKSLKSNADLVGIPVIMFSAYYKKKEECMEAGANNFLEKPFEMKALLEMIASFAC
ncbi:MAG: response regulator [Bacteroidota bacterium]